MRAVLVLAVCGCTAGTTTGTGPVTGAEAPPSSPAQPQPAAASAGIVRGTVAVDGERACAVEASGKVACWGRSGAGRADFAPVEVPGLEDVVGVAAGQSATCAWTARGAVACWELDPAVRFGPRFDDIVQVSVGISSACGLHATGRVSCWANGSGDARDVAGVTGVVEIAGVNGVGAERLCVRSKAGDVSCGNQVSPFEAIRELAGATSLGGAGARFAALLPDQRLATWVGWTGRPMPAFIDGVDGERAIVGGHLNGDAGVCVLGARARCWDWANEPSGALSELPPLRAGVRDLALDTEATCARVGDRLECWGRVGRLGDGEAEYPRDFVSVKGVADARQLEAVGRTMCALRAAGRVVCWGERFHDEDAGGRASPIDREPVELPGVTDAVEIAMEQGDRSDGTIVAVAVCARRPNRATCWTIEQGQLKTSDAPELASAAKLYSGPAICGASASGAVRCALHHQVTGHVPGFSEDDYEKYIYQGPADGAARRVARELEKRLRGALAARRQLDGFHAAGQSDTVGRIGPALRPPMDALTGVVELRRTEWTLDWDIDRVRGALCARRSDGTVACWGERDYLGAGQRSARASAVTVTNVKMGPPRHVTLRTPRTPQTPRYDTPDHVAPAPR